MNQGINKVIIVGNLGANPEVKFLPNGTAVAKFNVATSESWKNRETGKRENRTEWHKVVMFGKTAELVGELLMKGNKVYLEGANRTRSWENEKGKQYMTEVHCSLFQRLNLVEGQSSSKKEGAGPDDDE